MQRTNFGRLGLAALDGVRKLPDRPVVREFALALEAPVDRVIERCAAAGINAGFALGREYDEFSDGLLVAITEQRTRADIDRFVEVLGDAVADERAGAKSEVAA
jgi:glycine dehydrogenase subunit 1